MDLAVNFSVNCDVASRTKRARVRGLDKVELLGLEDSSTAPPPTLTCRPSAVPPMSVLVDTKCLGLSSCNQVSKSRLRKRGVVIPGCLEPPSRGVDFEIGPDAI